MFKSSKVINLLIAVIVMSFTGSALATGSYSSPSSGDKCKSGQKSNKSKDHKSDDCKPHRPKCDDKSYSSKSKDHKSDDCKPKDDDDDKCDEYSSKSAKSYGSKPEGDDDDDKCEPAPAPKPSASAELACSKTGAFVTVKLANSGNAEAKFDVNGQQYSVKPGANLVVNIAVAEDTTLNLIIKSGYKVLIDKSFKADCVPPPPAPVCPTGTTGTPPNCVSPPATPPATPPVVVTPPPVEFPTLISIHKVALKPSVLAGKVVTWRVVVTNSSAKPVKITLRDTLAGPLSLTKSPPMGISLKSGVLTYQVTLPASSKVTVNYATRVSKTSAKKVCNTAYVSADGSTTMSSRACVKVVRKVVSQPRIPVTG